MLAVQLRPHVVAEADECCPVSVTGQRLTTAADTAACREMLVGSFLSRNQREERGERRMSPEKHPWLAAMWSQLEKRKQERGKISAAGLCQVKSVHCSVFSHSR